MSTPNKIKRSSDEGTFQLHRSAISCNNGFWNREPEERAARMDAACEHGGVSNFFDLSPEERAATYDRE